MTKDELKEKIKLLVKQVYKPASNDDTIDNTPSEEFNKFPILSKFPPLKEVIETLLTSNYEPFISEIQWVAPNPLTFRVMLANNELFYLIYTSKSWIAQIEGKKYYLLNIGEEEFACEALSRLLYYGNQAIETPEEKDIEVPEEEPAEESTPEEETPTEA